MNRQGIKNPKTHILWVKSSCNLSIYSSASLFSGLSHILPQVPASRNLLLPAAMSAAHLQQLLAQIYATPMTPDASPSAPSVTSSNATPPRNLTPVTAESSRLCEVQDGPSLAPLHPETSLNVLAEAAAASPRSESTTHQGFCAGSEIIERISLKKAK